MPSQSTIKQLPQAGVLTGNELVPLDQNGQTVQAKLSAIAGITGGINPQAFITPAPLPGGLTSDWNPPGLAAASILRVNSANTAFSLDGIQAPATGAKFLLLINANTAEADMTLISAAHSVSAAANQLLIQHSPPAGLAIGYQGGVWLYYDTVATKWIVLA